VLGPYGDVLPCEPLRRPVGNLREAGFDLPAILDGERMRAFAEERLGPGKCHCNWGCAIGNAVAQDRSFYPALARRLVLGARR
jgi:MoaA/NifB/PqqE/SkfB family radical SAM enzyme